MGSFIICTCHQIPGRSNGGEWGGQGMWYAKERRVKYRVLVGKPEGKRPLGRPWRGLEDGI
jgi:hypothetical protein